MKLLSWNVNGIRAAQKKGFEEFMRQHKPDILAIQETKDSLGGLEKLQRKLGKKYRFIFSDPSGNGERLVFCYDSTQIQFTGLAAEIVMVPGAGRDNKKPELEFDRTPYMASFRKNGCNFILVTVHIYYGNKSRVRYRLEEIKNIAKYLKKRSKDVDALDSDFIACGDFNIEDVRQKENKRKRKKSKRSIILNNLFKALRSGGLIVPKDIQNSPSNLKKTKHFDQIGFHKYKDSTIEFKKGGVIDFVDAVYIGDEKVKFKLTDHLPMWAVFSTSKDKEPKFLNP